MLALTSDGYFHTINLLDNAKIDGCEKSVELCSIMGAKQSTLKKLKEKKEDSYTFVSFCQAASNTDIALCPLQLLFMTNKGEVFTLCPFLVENFVLPLDTCDDLDQFLMSKKDKYSYHTLLTTLRRRKLAASKRNPGLLEFKLTSEDLETLAPKLVGPIAITSAHQSLYQDYTGLLPYGDLPFTFMRVSLARAEVILSFFSPAPSLIREDITEVKESGSKYIKAFEQEVPEKALSVFRDSLDNNLVYVQSASKLHALNFQW